MPNVKHWALLSVNFFLGVQVENLAHNFPVAIKLHQIEKIGEAVTRPIVWVHTHIGTCSNNVNRTEGGLDVFSGSIAVVPVKESLNGAAKQIWADITIDGCA